MNRKQNSLHKLSDGVNNYNSTEKNLEINVLTIFLVLNAHLELLMLMFRALALHQTPCATIFK